MIGEETNHGVPVCASSSRNTPFIDSAKMVTKKVIKKKVKKCGPHTVAPEITEELRKQKSYRKG